MTTQATTDYGYPLTEKFGGHTVTLKLMRPQSEPGAERALLKFTQGLPVADLVFVRVDVTQPDVVHEWVENVARGRTITVLAEEDGGLVGYGNLHFSRQQWTRHIGELRVLVGEQYRGIGLGERLVDALVRIAHDRRLKRVIVHIASNQPRVRAMFDRLGFNAEALLTDWLKDRNHQKHDVVIMSYEIDE